MLKLNDRERKIVIGGGAFLGLLIVYSLFVGPYLSSRKELNEKLAESYRRYADYTSTLAGESTYQQQLQTRRSDMVAVSRLLLSGNTSSLAAAELSNKIRDFANDTGVSITRENVNQPIQADHHLQISIQLNMSCDVIALRDFLKSIEEDANLLVISSLEINAPASMRRFVRGRSLQRRQSVDAENLRVTMTVSGFIEGDEVPAEKKK